MNAKVTIGLCVKNAEKILKPTLVSISIQDYPHKFMKLVIVDNGSSDNTLSLISDFAKETDIKTFVTSSKGKGLGASRQVVVDNAEGDYIVWVDDDHVLWKDFIRTEVEFMRKNPHVGASQAQTIPIPLRTIIDVFQYGVLITPNPENPKQIGTGGSIFRLKALESVGGFDVQIKGAGEDLDVSRRIRESGWALANNNSKFSQKYPPTTLKSLWKQNYWYGYGSHLLSHKFKDNIMLLEYFPPFVLYVGLKASFLIYRIIKKKKVFVFSILYFITEIAKYKGFMRAHLDGYGHSNYAF